VLSAAAAAAARAMLRHSMLRAGARPLVSSFSRQQLPIISHLYTQSSKTQSVAASCLPVAPYGSAHRIVPYGKLNSHLLPLAAQADLSIRSFSTRRRPPPRQEPPEEDPSTARDKIMKRLGSLGAVGYLLLAKTKYVLVALKLTKAAPLVSMVLTSATYSLFFGWPFAVGMVGQTLLHELGHAGKEKWLCIITLGYRRIHIVARHQFLLIVIALVLLFSANSSNPAAPSVRDV
jgi:hypothetical protein